MVKTKRHFFSHITITKLKKIKNCQICNKSNMDLQKHHKIPLKNGGSNNIKNIIMICRECHKKEHK